MDDIQSQRDKNKLRTKLMDKAWHLEECRPAVNISIMMYIYDPLESGEIALAGMTEQDIERVSKIDASMAEICDTVSFLFERYARSSKAQRRETIRALGASMGLYMVRTKNYEELRSNIREGYRHFIILLYPNRYSGETVLRPAAVRSGQELLTTDDVREFGQRVVAHDVKVNPGYFNVSRVIPFPRP